MEVSLALSGGTAFFDMTTDAIVDYVMDAADPETIDDLREEASVGTTTPLVTGLAQVSSKEAQTTTTTTTTTTHDDQSQRADHQSEYDNKHDNRNTEVG